MSPEDYDNPWKLTLTTAERISIVCDEVKAMLLQKNAAYGDSALQPLRVFSRADAQEQLLVRIDDKLSRIARGHEFENDDTVLDLIGYLILLRVAQDKR
jgi:chromosome condensin MukBEF complex kleisin-like MukF subunit